MADNKPKINYEIVEKIAEIFPENYKGLRRELNLISWNGYKPKYDLRDWTGSKEEGNLRMTKGLTFNDEELAKLRDVLNTLELPSEEVTE